MTGVSVRIDHGVCLLRLALWLTWHGIGQRQGTSESETAGKEIAAVHGRASGVRGKSSLRSYPDWTQPVKRRGLVLSSHHEPRLGGRNGQELRPRHNTRDAHPMVNRAEPDTVSRPLALTGSLAPRSALAVGRPIAR